MMKKQVLLSLIFGLFALGCFSKGWAQDPKVPWAIILTTENKTDELTLTMQTIKPIKIKWGEVEKDYTPEQVAEAGGELSGTTSTGRIVIYYFDKDAITSLSVAGLSLTRVEFSGISDISEFSAPDNKLTWIALEQCPNLTYLNLSRNKFEEMFGTYFKNLEDLRLDGCGLKSFNLQHCPNLRNFSIRDNEFTELDLSILEDLESIECSKNSLAGSIDFSVCPKLKTIKAKGNQLTNINVSGLSFLVKLEVDGNELLEVKAKDNSSLAIVDLTNNKMDACALDDLYRALPKKAQKITVGKDLLVKNNPGAKTAKSSLAEENNWVIDQKGDGTGCEKALEETTSPSTPYAFIHEGEIWVVTPASGYAATLYTLDGKHLATQSVPCGTASLSATLASGNYLVVVEAEGKEPVTIKVIL